MAKKILVIDDDEMNRKILIGILEEHDFTVVQAEDGVEGMKRLQENPDVSVILLDRMMPNMNGMEFMDQFRRNPKWARIPVIMQTAANHPKHIVEGNRTGVYYYLTKPFEEEMVISLVRSALEDVNR